MNFKEAKKHNINYGNVYQHEITFEEREAQKLTWWI